MRIQFQIFNELLEFESNDACAFHRHHCSRVRLIQLQLGLRKSLVLNLHLENYRKSSKQELKIRQEL